MWKMEQLSFIELMEARIEIQDIIIRLAVQKGTEEDFIVLDNDIAKTKQHLEKDTNIDRKCTQSFYTLLANIADNRVFTMIVKALSETVLQSPPYTPDIIRVKEEFMKHLRTRNVAKASGVMHNHLVSLKVQVKQHVVTGNQKKKQENQHE